MQIMLLGMRIKGLGPLKNTRYIWIQMANQFDLKYLKELENRVLRVCFEILFTVLGFNAIVKVISIAHCSNINSLKGVYKGSFLAKFKVTTRITQGSQ